MVVVAISGVGGTGKTSVAGLLAKKLKWRLVRLNDLAERTDAYIGYDERRKSKIVSVAKLKREMEKLGKTPGGKNKNLVIEGLYAHEFPADFVIVLRCNPRVLERRLRKKYKWETKIVENKEAEMINLVTEEALEFHQKEKNKKEKVFEIDTTKKTVPGTVKIIEKILKNRGKSYRAGRINWLE